MYQQKEIKSYGRGIPLLSLHNEIWQSFIRQQPVSQHHIKVTPQKVTDVINCQLQTNRPSNWLIEGELLTGQRAQKVLKGDTTDLNGNEIGSKSCFIKLNVHTCSLVLLLISHQCLKTLPNRFSPRSVTAGVIPSFWRTVCAWYDKR